MSVKLLAQTSIFGIFILLLGCTGTKKERWVLSSPDNTIQISVQTVTSENQGLSLVYEVSALHNGKTTRIIEPSPLGIIREDQQFSKNLSFVSEEDIRTIDETYSMHIGRKSKIHNHAKEMALTFKNEEGFLIQLVLRAYNDGVAFKYVFPEKSDSAFTITNELTGFKIPVNGKAWIERYDSASKWTPAYEKFYENGIPIGTSSPNKEGWAFPALFNTNDYWVLLAEANLSPTYCGVRLEQNAPEGLYKIRFPDPKDGLGTGIVEPSSSLPWSLPWRTIIIGPSPGTIFESEMINNVSDPAVEGDFSWVKPGRASWSWLTENNSPKNFAALKAFVDLAADMKWEYSLVDANWDLMEGGTIEQLVNYANTRNIGILMWYNSGGPQNEVTERPRDIMYNAQMRKDEFKKLKEWGVKGVKIDFWHSDKQNLIGLYLDVLKDAAQNNIMVNFHGCTIPRGWSRTYPNLVSMEAVNGEENYLFNPAYPNEALIQNSILPFTRNVIGPMDYTPVVFSNLKYPHQTSFAHELALSVVFNSGIIHMGDNPGSYSALPAYVINFLKKVPATFDESHFISGYPGKDMVMAARKNKEWFIAGINSEKEPKDLTIELPWIGSGSFEMDLITDGIDQTHFANKQMKFSAGEKFKIKMPGNGGFVFTLNPQ